MLLQDAIQDWLDHLQYQRRYSGNTRLAYGYDLRAFVRIVEFHTGRAARLTDLRKLDIHDFRQYLLHRRGNNPRNSTIRRGLAAVKSFFLYLEIHKLGKYPADLDRIRLPKKERTLPRPLTVDQALLFTDLDSQPDDLDWIRKRNIAVYTLMYGGGLRISEAVGLPYASRPSERAEFIVIKGKGGFQRHVPVLKPMIQAVDDYLAESPHSPAADGPLFYSRHGLPLSPRTVQRNFQQLKLEYDLPAEASPHSLRHSCASHLVSEGADLRHVQALLGHRNLVTTQGYTDIPTGRMIEMYQAAHPRA